MSAVDSEVVSVQVLAGVVGIALVVGVIVTQGRMLRQSAAMRRRIESLVDARIASGTRPPSHPPAEAVIVARARDETAPAWALSLGLVAWLAIGNFAVPLDGLSPRWQEIVATISAVSGRPHRSMQERAFPVKQPTDRVRAPSLGCPERGQARQVHGDMWTRAQLASQ